MGRFPEDGFDIPAFDQPGVLHDVNTVAHLPDHRQVMSDQQHGGIFFLHAHQQPEDLRLYRHVQGGRGFVCDNEPGFQHQGHGDHHALAHPAGQVMGVERHPLLRVRQAHLVQPFHTEFPGRIGVQAGMEAQHLAELPADPVQG